MGVGPSVLQSDVRRFSTSRVAECRPCAKSKEYTMKFKPQLTQQDVSLVMNAARTEAQRNLWAVTVVVVDDGGHPLALERLDRCAPAGAYVAMEKARTAALARCESGLLEQRINSGRSALLSSPLSGMLEGGVPIVIEGEVVGAIGVSGAKPDQDAQVAKAGAAAAIANA